MSAVGHEGAPEPVHTERGILLEVTAATTLLPPPAEMSKLALMGRAFMSTASALNPARRLPALRRFSTEAEVDQQPKDQTPPPLEAEPQQQQDQTPPIEGEAKPQETSFDPFLQGSGEGMVFGRLTGIGRNTMKTDVIHFLEGCNLSTDDVKVEYNRANTPVGMMLQFSSRSSYETALRQITRKGRLYRLDTMDRSQWDITSTFNGKTVLLQGLPRNALQEDVERFLSGCNFDPTSIQINFRNLPKPMKFALVQFQSRQDAMNAYTFKNNGFCLNNPITMRVLH